MGRGEAIELALHRALRAELHPCIRAVAAAISPTTVEVRVFHHDGSDFDPRLFEEVIASEFDQNPPAGLSPLPRLKFSFAAAEAFQDPMEGLSLIYSNEWAAG